MDFCHALGGKHIYCLPAKYNRSHAWHRGEGEKKNKPKQEIDNSNSGNNWNSRRRCQSNSIPFYTRSFHIIYANFAWGFRKNLCLCFSLANDVIPRLICIEANRAVRFCLWYFYRRCFFFCFVIVFAIFILLSPFWFCDPGNCRNFSIQRRNARLHSRHHCLLLVLMSKINLDLETFCKFSRITTIKTKETATAVHDAGMRATRATATARERERAGDQERERHAWNRVRFWGNKQFASRSKSSNVYLCGCVYMHQMPKWTLFKWKSIRFCINAIIIETFCFGKLWMWRRRQRRRRTTQTHTQKPKLTLIDEKTTKRISVVKLFLLELHSLVRKLATMQHSNTHTKSRTVTHVCCEWVSMWLMKFIFCSLFSWFRCFLVYKFEFWFFFFWRDQMRPKYACIWSITKQWNRIEFCLVAGNIIDGILRAGKPRNERTSEEKQQR